MLVRHGVWVRDAGDLLDAGETRLELLLAAGHDNDTLAGIATGSPEKVALMPADGGRQAVFRTEQVDGTGLPVILAEDRGFGPDVRREAVVHARDSGRHLLPAELVGKNLRQRPEPVSFDCRRSEM